MGCGFVFCLGCGCYGRRRCFAALTGFSLSPCLDVTLFECGDASPLLVASRLPLARRASRETTDSGEASPHSKKVTSKQARAAKHRRTPNSHTQGRRQNQQESRRPCPI